MWTTIRCNQNICEIFQSKLRSRLNRKLHFVVKSYSTQKKSHMWTTIRCNQNICEIFQSKLKSRLNRKLHFVVKSYSTRKKSHTVDYN